MMNLCKFGVHRWEEVPEEGTLGTTVKECKDCGTVIKRQPWSTVYEVPEGADARIVKPDRKLLWVAAGGIVAAALILLKSRK